MLVLFVYTLGSRLKLGKSPSFPTLKCCLDLGRRIVDGSRRMDPRKAKRASETGPEARFIYTFS